MEGRELVEKAFAFNEEMKFPYADMLRAEAAFFANIVGLLAIKLPKTFGKPNEDEKLSAENLSRFMMFFYSGVLVGLGKSRDLNPDVLETAHKQMVFPHTRAIISSMLGFKTVTSLGVPKEYKS